MNTIARPFFRFFLLITVVTATACSTMTATEKAAKREALDRMADETIAELVADDPGLQQAIDRSLAWAVADIKLTKVPIVGAGGGQGVFYHKESQRRIYFTVSRFDLGGGWGVRVYKALILIDSPEVLKRAKGGLWEFQAGAEASAGSAAVEGAAGVNTSGYTIHVLSEGGASATVTARVIRLKAYRALNE